MAVMAPPTVGLAATAAAKPGAFRLAVTALPRADALLNPAALTELFTSKVTVQIKDPSCRAVSTACVASS